MQRARLPPNIPDLRIGDDLKQALFEPQLVWSVVILPPSRWGGTRRSGSGSAYPVD